MLVSISRTMDIPLPTDPHIFGGAPLDRDANIRRDEAAIEALKVRENARFLPFWDLRGLIVPGEQPELAWLPMSELEAIAEDRAEVVYLGLDGDAPCFAVGLAGEANPAKEGSLEGRGKFIDARTIATQLGGPDTAILAQGRSLIDWHARHRFCAACGAPTEAKSAGNSRTCPACNAEHFPRTDPVAIMLVIRDGKCLLGRKNMFPEGMYSALAGFIEVGETIEEGVRREIFEESGVRAGEVRYHSSQPWPFPSSLMIGCIAEGLTEEITIDEQELDHAAWFSRAEIVEGMERALTTAPGDGKFRMPHPIAIAHQLARAWLAETN